MSLFSNLPNFWALRAYRLQARKVCPLWSVAHQCSAFFLKFGCFLNGISLYGMARLFLYFPWNMPSLIIIQYENIWCQCDLNFFICRQWTNSFLWYILKYNPIFGFGWGLFRVFFLLLVKGEMKKTCLTVIYTEEYVVIQLKRYLIETSLSSLYFSFFLEVKVHSS